MSKSQYIATFVENSKPRAMCFVAGDENEALEKAWAMLPADGDARQIMLVPEDGIPIPIYPEARKKETARFVAVDKYSGRKHPINDLGNTEEIGYKKFRTEEEAWQFLESLHAFSTDASKTKTYVKGRYEVRPATEEEISRENRINGKGAGIPREERGKASEDVQNLSFLAARLKRLLLEDLPYIPSESFEKATEDLIGFVSRWYR